MLQLDKHTTIIERYGAMGLPEKKLIGKRLDIFIINPDEAGIFRLNLATIRIFGGGKTINTLLCYKGIVTDYCFHIERTINAEIIIFSKKLLPAGIFN